MAGSSTGMRSGQIFSRQGHAPRDHFRWCASAVPFGAVCAHPHEQRPCTTTPDPESPTKFGVSPVYRLKSANTSAEAAATCASPNPAPVPPSPDATASPSLRLWPPAPRAACEGLERRIKSQGRQCDTVFLDFSCSQAANPSRGQEAPVRVRREGLRRWDL